MADATGLGELMAEFGNPPPMIGSQNAAVVRYWRDMADALAERLRAHVLMCDAVDDPTRELLIHFDGSGGGLADA